MPAAFLQNRWNHIMPLLVGTFGLIILEHLELFGYKHICNANKLQNLTRLNFSIKTGGIWLIEFIVFIHFLFIDLLYTYWVHLVLLYFISKSKGNIEKAIK